MILTARLSPRIHRCMHCARDIEQAASGTWVDSDGFSYCQKPAGDYPAISHRPLPAI